MERLSFVRYFAFSTLRQLIGKRIEALVQLAPEGRYLHLGLYELFELHRKCVQINESGDSHSGRIGRRAG